ncbi:hypothetical protein [Bacillus atrophaeus]|uniref:hypothetical protein n=1 Tax=Bacillus atrophaeus TaxID=1452 RepID=UPI002E228E4D|nr:hypothetical protein [Bacillus atrophaeus]MED1031652.1 hypothetical protein [Bacillus atrophaeus]MED1120811.1 hypothetical protein [Bacillus atrophaeus]MED1133721.1 hypothetical protein [Bacillus atrophaeus]
MKKIVLPFVATFVLASGTMFSYQGTASATSINTEEEEWVTVEESNHYSSSILETEPESPDADVTAKDYTTNWSLKKIRSGTGFFKCKYAMLTKAKAKMKIKKIEAKSRLYNDRGGLEKSVTDTNNNSNYSGAEAIGGVTGGWGCKGSAYGNSKYERKGYKTVSHQKKWNISDAL